ncbi:MAG TPA: hypothetical protein VGR37_04300 [Longimicrobiaceae bacterium]|nr:hypothetical protein [Longimicrobiaceae bacterium]
MSFFRIARSAALVALFAAVPAAASAQAPAVREGIPKRAVSLMVGGFGSDINESTTFGIAAARLDQRLSRHFLAEAGLSFARGEVEIGDYSSSQPVFSRATTSLATATVGVQAEAPLGPVRPYVGIASGLYLRMDPSGGHRFLYTTTEFPAGVRVPLTERLGARAEVRLRYDEQQGNGPALGAETTVGVSLRF